MLTHIISALDATGQYEDVNAFAYNNSGKHCRIIDSFFWENTKETGMRVRVALADGTEGLVWEDELEPICNPKECDGCWQCDG